MITNHFELTRQQLIELTGNVGRLLIFYTAPSSNHNLFLIGSIALSIGTWLFSTRLKLGNKSIIRRNIFFLFMLITFVGAYNLFSINYLKPITYDKVLLLDTVVSEKYREYLYTGALKLLGTALMLIPALVTFFFLSWLYGTYREDQVLQDWFAEYKFDSKFLARFGEEYAMKFPDITLALDVVKKIPVVLLGASRQLGTLLIGPPGSGKTSMKIIKAVRQDLEHLQNTINDFPVLSEKYGVGSKEFLVEMGKRLTGIIVIEPSKDLCDKSYELAKEHGIPDELIVYLDVSNPETPGFEAMIGPIEQVAEMITAVLDGMSEVSNEFFRQACRTVLKQYTYLLKFIKKDDATLLDLDQMYQDPRFTKDMVEVLRSKIPDKEIIKRMPSDMQIYWMLVIRTIRWFDNDGLEEVRNREGMIEKYTTGEHKGKIMIKDKQAEFTRQTRNLLADLITNPYLARVLTSKNAVNLDKLMDRGGILLCNTDNGRLGNVSDAYGKLVLMSVQNAIFRRRGDENTRSLVSVYVDEFYDYMNSAFLKLSGQGRKYKAAFLVACQSLAQFGFKFNEAFVNSMIGTIRNFIVYGGVGQYDAKKLVPIFGTQVVEEVTVKESYTPESSMNASYSYSEGVTREEKPLVTENEVMYSKFKYSYIRQIIEGSTAQAVKAEGDFIDMGDAKKWKKRLKSKAVDKFMDYWRNDSESKYSFDMNWIDCSGDFVDPNTKELGADLEESIRKAHVGKADSNQDEEYELPAYPTLQRNPINEAPETKEENIQPKSDVPRASQIRYGQHKKSSSTIEIQEIISQPKVPAVIETIKNEKESLAMFDKDMKPNSELEKGVINFSSIFKNPVSSSAPPKPLAESLQKDLVGDQNNQQKDDIATSERLIDNEKPATKVSDHNMKITEKEEKKLKRRMDQLEATAIDVHSSKFMKQIFNILDDEK
ncbi:type IV secretory system conjugative DNA transfer family protein [Paenibacillus tepidiphilus]|uniref:type IV secretory system conjugative DNA transfer family protein n=1 Tax=Paenibacillus tepidiphilus TaxID=2608683 RepID=UPI0013A5629A|nr:type IV secretion system DNA-binding domain-containing protein [Paenibacillus tepidiphilus]